MPSLDSIKPTLQRAKSEGSLVCDASESSGQSTPSTSMTTLRRESEKIPFKPPRAPIALVLRLTQEIFTCNDARNGEGLRNFESAKDDWGAPEAEEDVGIEFDENETLRRDYELNRV